MKAEKVGYVSEKGEVFGPFGWGDRPASLNLNLNSDKNASLSLLIAGQMESPVSITKFTFQAYGKDWVEKANGKLEAVFVFRNLVFRVTTPVSNSAATEAMLTVKREALLQDQRLKRLQNEVDALERIAEGKVQRKREPIPDAVKLLVYERDGGKCVKCGSDKNLHFDQIIPISKGGGNTDQNVQLLCERCNLEKSDKIA